MAEPIYRRVLVKVSGEALAGTDGAGIHQATLEPVSYTHLTLPTIYSV